MKILVKTRKHGDSLAVTLPNEFVKNQKIKDGRIIEITIKKARKDGFGVFKNMKPFTADDELTAHA